MDPVLGFVHLSRSLEKTDRPDYELTVSATDGGSPPNSATVLVKVKVQLAKNTSPVFRSVKIVVSMENICLNSVGVPNILRICKLKI